MIALQFLLTSLLAQSPVAAQQSQPASIQGFVLKTGTAEPIAKARITLSLQGRSESQTTVSGGNGSFAFQSVPAGLYRLTVSRTGFLNKAYARGGEDAANSVLTLTSGQTLTDVRLLMTPASAISGRVYDPDGDPVPNVLMQALKYSYVNEQLSLTVVNSAQTDDRGEYRLFALPPGRYYVKAAGAADGLIIAAAAGFPGAPLLERGDSVNSAEKFVPVYFPGTVDSKSAEPVELRAGADFGGVDLTVVKARTHRLRGSVTNGITGRPPTFAMVSLTSRDSGFNMPGGRVDSEGKFEIQNVLPGSYFLGAALRAGAERPLSGRTPIVVGDADLDNLSIVLSPGEDIPGQVIVEGNSQPGLRSHPIITFQSGRSVFDAADFANNTTFTIHNVVEGDYDLRIYDVGQNQYVKSIRFGSADVSNGSFHVGERNSGSLEFILGTTNASIDGVVRTTNGAGANMRVTLIPDAAHVQRADLYRSTSTADISGRFHFEAVAPGNYTLFAWEDVEEGIWHDPEFVKRFENLGTPVHIDEANSVTVELHPVSTAY